MAGAILLNCIKIFCCRILDVTCGVIRTMLTVKEKSALAAAMGFCEVFIWYLVVRNALNSDGPMLATACAYAGGFAAGTYIGSRISKKLIKGFLTVQVVTSNRDEETLRKIRDAGYAITVLKVLESDYGEAKYMIIANVDKAKLKNFEALINELDEKAFILVEETKSYVGGYFGTNK